MVLDQWLPIWEEKLTPEKVWNMILPPKDLMEAAETYIKAARKKKANQSEVHVRRGDHAWMNWQEKSWQTSNYAKKQQINNDWKEAD